MRGEARPSRGLVWLLAGVCACTAGAAAAQPLPVTVSLTYQRLESQGLTQEFWSRNLNASYTRLLRPQLQLSSQLRIASLDYVGSPNQSFTPYGDLRLYHPQFGIMGSYRPSSTTNTTGLTTNEREAQLSAYAAPVGLPRVDVLWTRRRVDARDGAPGGVNLTRNAQLQWVRGPLELRGALGDIRLDNGAGAGARSTQSNWSAGSTYRASRPSWNLTGSFDVSDVRTGGLNGLSDGARTENGQLNWLHRLTPKLDWSANYIVRASQLETGPLRDQTTQEGSVTGNYRPNRAALLVGGFGLRPVTGTDGSTQDLGYAVVTASVQGRVRPGWTGLASAGQTLNHAPSGVTYLTGSYRASSKFVLERGWDLNLDGTVNASGDPLQGDQKVTSQVAATTNATPLRRLTISYTIRAYRAGTSLGRVVAHSSAQALDVRWQPLARLDLTGNLSQSGALPAGKPSLTTRLANARLTASQRLQMEVTYSNSSESRADVAATHLGGREVWTSRVLAGLGRRYRLSLGGTIVDPGKPTRSRQADASISAQLGGGS